MNIQMDFPDSRELVTPVIILASIMRKESRVTSDPILPVKPYSLSNEHSKLLKFSLKHFSLLLNLTIIFCS